MKQTKIASNVIDIRPYVSMPVEPEFSAASGFFRILERVINSASAIIMAVCITLCTLLFFTML